MKKDTHPTYHKEATFSCVCGISYKMGSTNQSVNVEICKNCHPFYTGQEKNLDTTGRVDRFKKKLAKSSSN
jgi:large subunit ribosomal protein L31